MRTSLAQILTVHGNAELLAQFLIGITVSDLNGRLGTEMQHQKAGVFDAGIMRKSPFLDYLLLLLSGAENFDNPMRGHCLVLSYRNAGARNLSIAKRQPIATYNVSLAIPSASQRLFEIQIMPTNTGQQRLLLQRQMAVGFTHNLHKHSLRSLRLLDG